MANTGEGIVSASITVLDDTSTTSITPEKNDNTISAHDVLKTVLPDILADIVPNLPKNKLDKYIENIKNHIPQDIPVKMPEITNNTVKLGLSPIERVDDVHIDINNAENNASNIVPSPLSVLPPHPSPPSETSSQSTVQGLLNGLMSLVQGSPPIRKSKFCILKKGTSELDKEILGYIRKINETIGYYWWKQYFYTGFWNYITTPINLAITVLTALTTGQSATQGLITTKTSTVFGAVVLCLSLFQTFFRSNDQYNNNKAILKQWADMGVKFDGLYMDKVSDDNKDAEKLEKLKKLQELFKQVSQLKKDNDSNFLVDILYTCLRCICLRNGKLKWSQDLSASDEEDI